MTRAAIAAVVLAVAGCNVSSSKPAARAPSAAEQRAKAGPYIASTKKISEQEEMSTLVLPSSIGPVLDQHCFIYRHLEFKQARVICPDAINLDASAIEQ